MAPADRAARERKQKIFVVVGGLLLLGILAIQLPKLLGGSSSSSAAPAEQTTFATEPAGAPTPQRAAAVALTDTDRHPGITVGKLRSFSVFSAKDPFVQQVETNTSFGNAGTASKSDGAKAETPKITKGFTVGKSTPALTIVSVNGVRQALEAGATFPASDPVFVLVAEQSGAKTAVIGVAGGAYASGAKTTKLEVGKPLTLVNTTTGARYRIVLVAVGSGVDAGAAKTKP